MARRGPRWTLALVSFLLIPGIGSLLAPMEAPCAGKGRHAAPASSKDGTLQGEPAPCRGCHANFYESWSASRHGLAVQPFTRETARVVFPQLPEPVTLGGARCALELGPEGGWFVERTGKWEKKYKIDHLMGGKNVFFLLTTLDKGRLQVLPLAYDVGQKSWLDAPADAVRHFIERGSDPQNWKDPVLTFDTACFHCHVLQFSSNYDPEKETYHNTWAEPGIRCAACHGPVEEHARVMKEVPKGEVPPDPKLIGWKSLSPQQKSEACAPCHGKIRSLTNSFLPGDRFLDHYDLVLFEDPDFYPDGRDRSENHTYVRWLMNPCAKSGKLDCLHCHEPGGQFRFQGNEKANDSCRPCHEDRVQNARSHTNHPEGSEGNRCIACHMPKTRSGSVWRSDHSMLPPTPAATMAFQSPNACTLCHHDKEVQWADEWVRKRKTRDYQASTLQRARLIEEARKKDWSRLEEMLQFIAGKERDDVTAASIIRLLTLCEDERKWHALLGALRDGSPLVRASAAQGLAGNFSPEALKVLLDATEDEYRVVRVRAAMALSGYPRTMLSEEDFQALEKATAEFMASLKVHPDDWESQYNMGNYLLNRGRLPAALVAYETAARLDPRRILPYLNASIAAARLADMVKAEEFLQKALEIEPNSPAVNFHIALLRADQGDMPQAEKHLRATLRADPQMAEAACNLCVLLAKDRLEEAVQWCRKAHELDPRDGKYAYTLAFFERKAGKADEAVRILREAIGREAGNTEAILLLAEIYQEQNLKAEARELVVGALSNQTISSRDRYRLFLKLQEIDPSTPSGDKNHSEDQSSNMGSSPEREMDI